jgi:hypothetical protein
MSKTLSRRGVFRLGGLAGGLLLPFAGGKALSFVDMTEAAKFDVANAAFPVSRELAVFRHAAEGIVEWCNIGAAKNAKMPVTKFIVQLRAREEARNTAAHAIWSRPVQTWGDVADLAEVAWQYALKEEDFGANRLGRNPTGRLQQIDSRFTAETGDVRLAEHAAAMLIEGVLTLSAGRRYDPRIADGEMTFGPFVPLAASADREGSRS